MMLLDISGIHKRSMYSLMRNKISVLDFLKNLWLLVTLQWI